MLLSLELQNETTYTDLPSTADFEHWIQTALTEANYSETSEIVLRFVDKNEIQMLNREFRNKDKPTNVLSFPFYVPDFIEEHIPTLGDIIICLDVIKQEATEQNKTFTDHLAHMVVHGSLHLLGFDHLEDNEAKEMENLEIAILARLSISNPYLVEE